MVKPFQFSRLPRIIFRVGAIKDLSKIINPYGREIVLVTGRQSFLKSELSGLLLDELARSGISFHIVQVTGEPSPELIDNSVRQFKGKNIKAVIGIGGGSVLDAGKAIAAMMSLDYSVIEYLEVVGTKDHPGTTLPFIAVPTTSGTGSEATKNAVISRVGPVGFKRSLRHDNFVPEVAVVDPELTLNCPYDITAASGMDCFTQLVESYLSVKSAEYTDALALRGLQAVKDSLSKVLLNGSDLEARTGMSFAALTSGICLANAGLGSVHGFASSAGAMFNIPHGVICGTLMAKANEVNLRELRHRADNREALEKYAILGKLFLDTHGKSDEYYADGFVSYLKNLTEDFHLPRMAVFGITSDDIPGICNNTDIKNNPVKLSVDHLIEIITDRI